MGVPKDVPIRRDKTLPAELLDQFRVQMSIVKGNGVPMIGSFGFVTKSPLCTMDAVDARGNVEPLLMST